VTLKRIRFERPLEGVSMESFRAVWQGEHAPRMAERTQALRYIGTFFGPSDGLLPHYPHAVSLWYEDAEHQRHAYSAPPDPTDPIRGVMGRDSVLLETVEHVVRGDSARGLHQLWYVIESGSDTAETRRLMVERTEHALALVGANAAPSRCTVSVVTAESPSQEIDAVVELGWSTIAQQAEAELGLAGAEDALFHDALRLFVEDQVAIIGAV
jgi:hypothetical protein